MIIKVTSHVGSCNITKQIAHVFRVANFEIQADRIPGSIGVAAGNLAAYNGTTWVAVAPPTLDNQHLIADLGVASKMRWASVSGTGDIANRLINGGFDLAQRQTPGTLTTIADNGYAADRWRISRQNADLQYQRQDALAEASLTCQYYGTFKKITNDGKLAIFQILEGTDSVPLRGRTVTFQAKIKSAASYNFRMAILELQNAGTIDAIPASIISAWNSSGTDKTFGANVAINTGEQTKDVTSIWQQ